MGYIEAVASHQLRELLVLDAMVPELMAYATAMVPGDGTASISFGVKPFFWSLTNDADGYRDYVMTWKCTETESGPICAVGTRPLTCQQELDSGLYLEGSNVFVGERVMQRMLRAIQMPGHNTSPCASDPIIPMVRAHVCVCVYVGVVTVVCVDLDT